MIYYKMHSKVEHFNMGTYTKQSKINLDYLNEIPNIKAYICVARHGTRFPTKKMLRTLDNDIQIVVPKDIAGRLTVSGIQECYDYGRAILEKIPQIFSYPERYLVFSTTILRARESAEAFLLGIGNKKEYGVGPEIDKYLKINDFFKKNGKPPAYVNSCQFAKLLGLSTKGCISELIDYWEGRRDLSILRSMDENSYKAYPFYKLLNNLIRQCIWEHRPKGFVFFCHDSTLAPLYQLFGLVDKQVYTSGQWLPFLARLEIVITKSNQVIFFVNGVLKNIL